MTAEEAKNRLIAWAVSQLGTHEGDNNNNPYADMPELREMYGWNPQNQPWCDVFVDAGFCECFGLTAACAMTYQPMGQGSALCRQSAQFYADHDAYVHEPEAGDQIFFYIGGGINHTGIVESVGSGIVHVIEGNSADAVVRRTYQVNDPSIAGYGRPKWTVVSEPADAPGGCGEDGCPIIMPGKQVDFPVLRCGMGGNWVAALQGILHYRKYTLGVCGIDGDFGVCTMGAVRNFQIRNGLTVDGIVGPETWSFLLPL